MYNGKKPRKEPAAYFTAATAFVEGSVGGRGKQLGADREIGYETRFLELYRAGGQFGWIYPLMQISPV